MQPFRVACCQVKAFDIEDAEANLQNLLAALDEAGRQGAHLVGLPECAYPAYYLKDNRPYDRPGVRPFDEVCALFAAKAKEHGYWLAAGMAVPHDDGTVTNSGVVFGPDGQRHGRYDKSFLWHFDTFWFEKGRDFPVFDTGKVRFGILICADGRQPEVARSLAVNGAEIIMDLTAWVSWGRSVPELSTTQCEYIMPVRAYENGVWVAASDKWGPEDSSIIYAGRSCVIDPSGAIRAAAPSDRDQVLVYDIEPTHPEPITRRPALYGRLAEPTASLPITELLDEAMAPARENRRVTVVPGNGAFDAPAMAARYRSLRTQDADLVVFGGAQGPEGWEVELPTLERAVRETGGALAFAVSTNGCMWGESAMLITPEGAFEHTATHGRGIATGELTAKVVPTAAGNVGILCGNEGLVPEVARALMLEGADILAWSMFEADPMAERVARARGDENRVYVAAAWPDGGVIVAPSGAPLTAVPAATGVAMTAPVNKALARIKDMAPGTNAVHDRVPEAYGALVR